ncbi:Ion transport domain-containing protein [Plasmodiophora brassicae]|uniref:Ion transport domain-containing protein n=1 Tax=Plasmodiophora brassicae TaxID=37360 RepID=A0A0G4IVG6_PLABS|nr:hypothetical protein PBRA_001201 [Plasmodiophora brassicae]SPQ97312.1 unnamed protein product [Plasmodiophora brassicae]
MTPSLGAHPASAWYFVVYLVVGEWILLNYLLAATYGAFLADRSAQIAERFRWQSEALGAVFAILDHQRTGTIAERDFCRVMAVARPDLDPDHARVIFGVLDPTSTGTCSHEDWLSSGDFLQVRFRRAVAADDDDVDAAAGWSQMSTISVLQYLSQGAIVVNALVQVVFLCKGTDSFPVIESAAMVVGVVDVLISRRRFRTRTIYVDLCAFVVAALGYVLPPPWRVLRVVVVVRLQHCLPGVARLSAVVTPTLVAIAGLLLCLFYAFAMIGHIAFNGVVTGSLEQRVDAFSVMAHDTAEAWDRNAYYELHFNTFGRSLITLFTVTIGNSWNVITDGYVALTGSLFTGAFFATFYFLNNIAVLNVLTSLVINEFTVGRSTAHGRRWHQHVVDSLRRRPCADPTAWAVTRTIRAEHRFLDRLNDDIHSSVHLDATLRDRLPWRQTSFRPRLPDADPLRPDACSS